MHTRSQGFTKKLMFLMLCFLFSVPVYKLLQAINAENQDARASSSEGTVEAKVGEAHCCFVVRNTFDLITKHVSTITTVLSFSAEKNSLQVRFY